MAWEQTCLLVVGVNVTCADCAAAAADLLSCLLFTFAGFHSSLLIVSLLPFSGFILLTERVIDVRDSSSCVCGEFKLTVLFEKMSSDNPAPKYWFYLDTADQIQIDYYIL